MYERLIVLVDWYASNDRKKFADFAEKTGIKRDTVKNLYHANQKINHEHIEAICNAFPEFKMWLVFGEVHPELGQVSPEIEDTRKAY